MPATQDEPWRIVARNGLVQIDQTGQPVRDAELNEVLAIGAAVTTGFESSATISNGAQLMTMAANSRVAIPEEKQQGMTHVLQNMGSILFQVDHRQAPHFRVETPLLAAIVKGTTFEVAVNGEATSIAVTDGLVQVRAAEGDAEKDVPAGAAVKVAAAAPQTLVSVSPQELATASAASASASLLRGKSGSGGDASSSASAAIPSMNTSDGPVQPSLASAEPRIVAASGQGQAVPASDSSRPQRAPKKPQAQQQQNSPSPFNSTAFTVTLYVVGTLVGWVVFVVGFAFGRSVLRDMKAKAKSKQDKK